MAGPGVFHVEFGINETKLTQLLERKKYNEAEKLIRSTTVASYLDEGCYQRTPLYIVLCGIDAEERHLTPRNLFLAKLMMEYGANVNYRVPSTYFGSEYMGPGKSPLELVVEFFNKITKDKTHQEANGSHPFTWRLWDPIRYKVVGLDKQLIVEESDILQQLADLTFIMLANAGDTSVMDENGMTPLHRTVMLSQDLSITQLLCEFGADVNAQDRRGNTPLNILCDAFPFGVQDWIEAHPDDSPYNNYCSVSEKVHFLEFLLNHKDIDLNKCNKQGRTPIFHCIVMGEIHGAKLLLEHGCDTSVRGVLASIHKHTKSLSPLFASLCSLRMVSCHQDRFIFDVKKGPDFMSNLVDKGYFSKPAILDELHEHLEADFPESIHLMRQGMKLIHHLFGGTSSSLTQKCCRSIFHTTFIQNKKPHPELFFPQAISSNFSPLALETVQDWESYFFDMITEAALENLVNLLALPKDILPNLQIELLRLRMILRYKNLRWFKYRDQEMDASFDSWSDSSDTSPEEDDSDLEYW